MKPLRVLVSDDEPLALKRLAAMVIDVPGFTIVATCEDGVRAVAEIERMRPDIVLLDIHMPGLDGFDVIRRLGAAMPLVIFVTADADHALAAFRHHAFDYLTKPVAAAQLQATLARAAQRIKADRSPGHESSAPSIEGRTPARIPARSEGRMLMLDAEAVECVLVEGDYLELHVLGATHRIRMTLTEFERMHAHSNLVRVHRSAMVDSRLIREIAPTPGGDFAIVLRAGTRVISGRTYRARVLELIGKK